MKKLTLLFSLMMLLTGCAASKINRGVHENTFYSSNLPKVAISIDKSFRFTGSSKALPLRKAFDADVNTLVDATLYTFESGIAGFLINIERVVEKNWYVIRHDYSALPYLYQEDTELYLDLKFNTGIYLRSEEYGRQWMVKEFDTIFGTTIRLNIMYLEPVRGFWPTTRLLLSKEQEKFIEDFDERASYSFSILDYDDFMLRAGIGDQKD